MVKPSEPNICSLLTTTASVGGVEMKVGIDSGASTSIMSRDAAERYGIPVYPSLIEVENVHGTSTKIDGVTAPLEVIVHGVACTITFVVIVHKQFDVLLGAEWLALTDAGIYPGRGMIVFENEPIYLDNTSKETDELTESVLYVNVEDELDAYGSWEVKRKEHVIPQHLSACDKKKLTKILEKYSKVFAYCVEELGECKAEGYKINLVDKTPIRIPGFRYSIADKECLIETGKRWLAARIIEPSTSPYSFPLLVVPKKDGKRVAFDGRHLNAITVRENFPIPLISELLDSLSGSKFFTTLDFMLAYLQRTLAEESRPLCSFPIPGLGQFQFRRMPFGLRNAPQEFSRLMTSLLGHLQFVKVYFDDITIHSNTIEEHFSHIQAVLEIIYDAGLRLNPDKCHWCETKINILGFVISENTIAMDPKKVEAILERKEPRNITELQSFIGMVNHYRAHYPNLANDCVPLFNLLRKNVPFIWSLDCKTSFEKIKETLSSFPILRMFDPKLNCILSCDASGYAAAAILSQKDKSNKEFVVGYYSKLFNKHELNYSTTEKELLAVVYGFLHFRHYCHGNFTEVITDHSALQWLNNLKNPSGRLARWHLALQEFDHKITHRKGALHGNADALSRPVVYRVSVKEDEFDLNYKNLEFYEDKCLLHFLEFGKHLNGISKKQIKRVNVLSEKIVMNENKLFLKKESDILLIPKPLERFEIIKKAHALGHFSSDSVYKNLRDKYYWSNMIKDINFVCDQCLPCQRNKKYKFKYHPA